MKTKTFILVATYRVGMYPSVCVEAVEKLGKRACISVLVSHWLAPHLQTALKINLMNYQILKIWETQYRHGLLLYS